jgi:hypothetical protein
MDWAYSGGNFEKQPPIKISKKAVSPQRTQRKAKFTAKVAKNAKKKMKKARDFFVVLHE